MAYLLDIGASTFRHYVTSGMLPDGKLFAGVRRWHRGRTLAAFEGNQGGPQPVAANDDDPIMAGILAYGQTTKARARSTAARAPRRQ
jgi:hypothetical protein